MSNLTTQVAVQTAINSIKADTKVQSVLESWAPYPEWQATMKSIILGTSIEGILTGRIQGSDKIGFHNKTPKHINPFGYTGLLPWKDAIDVPVMWLHYDFFSKFFVTTNDLGENDSRLLWFRWSKETSSNVWDEQLNAAGLEFIKLMLTAQDSRRRRTTESIIGSMDKPSFKHYRACFDSKGNIVMPENVGIQHPALLKEDHANKGYFNMIMPDSVFAYSNVSGIMSMEDPKKALARISRLVQSPDAVPMGTKRVFVVDIPEGHSMTKWFYTGSGYIPSDFFEQVLVHRAVSPTGMKMTSMPMPKKWVKSLGEKNKDVIVLSKASYKSGGNGLVMDLLDINEKVLSKMSKTEMEGVLKERSSSIKLGNTRVRGWFVDVEYNITSFYGLYGLRTPDEDDLEEDTVDSDGNTVCKSSFYIEATESLAHDNTYPMGQVIMDKIEAKELYYAPQRMNIKLQEVANVYWSYGKEIGDKFIQSVLHASLKHTRESSKLGLDKMSGVGVDAVLYEETFLRDLAYQIYPHPEVGGSWIKPGKLDMETYTDQDLGRKCIQEFLYGAPNGINGFEWEGLFGPNNKVFRVRGKDYFIPAGAVMEEFAYQEDGSERWFMTGPARALQLLFSSIKGKDTNWANKAINHDMDMQKDLYGENVDNFRVEGFGNKVMLPAPWLKMDELAVLDPHYGRMNGRHVMGSKMPVLFDKAVAGFTLLTGVPKSVFGELSPLMRFGLKNAVFTNCDVMMDLRNDTDGDMHRVALIDTVPLYTGAPDHMLAWTKKYRDDEADLLIKCKEYKQYSFGDINEAVLAAALSKQYVGRATNALSTLGHLLQIFVSKDAMTFNEARVIRASYAMAIQDYIVAGIKHETMGNLFMKADFTTALYGKKIESRLVAREDFKLLISEYQKDNKSIMKSVSLFFENLDNLSGMAIDGVSPFSSRRVAKIEKHDYSQTAEEFYIKELDMFTKSFLRNSHDAQPTPGMADHWNDNVKDAYRVCMGNTYAYCNKYVLWEQAIPAHTDTVIGRLFDTWRHIRSNNG